MNKTIRTAVLTAAIAGARSAAASERIAIEPSAVGPVAERVARELAPTVEHLTNSEPWYQSRVTWGALLAVLAGALGAFGIVFDAETQSQVLDLIIAATPVAGGVIALWGRWKARKPIGA